MFISFTASSDIADADAGDDSASLLPRVRLESPIVSRHTHSSTVLRARNIGRSISVISLSYADALSVI